MVWVIRGLSLAFFFIAALLSASPVFSQESLTSRPALKSGILVSVFPLPTIDPDKKSGFDLSLGLLNDPKIQAVRRGGMQITGPDDLPYVEKTYLPLFYGSLRLPKAMGSGKVLWQNFLPADHFYDRIFLQFRPLVRSGTVSDPTIELNPATLTTIQMEHENFLIRIEAVVLAPYDQEIKHKNAVLVFQINSIENFNMVSDEGENFWWSVNQLLPNNAYHQSLKSLSETWRHFNGDRRTANRLQLDNAYYILPQELVDISLRFGTKQTSWKNSRPEPVEIEHEVFLGSETLKPQDLQKQPLHYTITGRPPGLYGVYSLYQALIKN